MLDDGDGDGTGVAGAVLWPPTGGARKTCAICCATYSMPRSVEAAVRQATIDRLRQAVADAEHGFVEPDLEARARQRLRQRPRDRVLVFRGVADEYVPHGALLIRSDAVCLGESAPRGGGIPARCSRVARKRRPFGDPLGFHGRHR